MVSFGAVVCCLVCRCLKLLGVLSLDEKIKFPT